MSIESGPSDALLRVFLEMAKDESLTKTAERLNVSQPSLSQHLHQIEAALGQRLMERHGRGLRLTEAGKELEHRLHGVYHHIDLSIARFRNTVGHNSGTICIAGVHNLNVYFLPPIARDLSAEYPDVNLRVLGRTSAESAKVVSEGLADIGLVYGTSIADERLAMLHLFNETMVVAAPINDPVVRRIRDDGAVPKNTPALVLPRGCSIRNMIDRLFPPGYLLIKAEVEALDAMLSLAGSGMGICILPSHLPIDFFKFYGLERLVLQRPKMMREVTLVFRKDVEQPPIVQALVRLIRAAARPLDVRKDTENIEPLPGAASKRQLATY
jgi:DNA-binding transcriptional LysR family regulator